MRLKKYGVILEEGQPWQPGGWLGQNDCIFRSSLWSIASGEDLPVLWSLLFLRKRWPEEISPPSRRMTRDPYIMYYCYLALYDKKEWIYHLTIPLRLYSPSVWAWRKYLITGSAKWKRRYERRAILGLRLFKYKVFARHLEAWMAYVADSDKVKGNLTFNKYRYKEYFAPWNYLINALCGISFLSDYTPKIRYAWSMETEDYYKTPAYSGPYQIDKDILNYVLANENILHKS